MYIYNLKNIKNVEYWKKKLKNMRDTIRIGIDGALETNSKKIRMSVEIYKHKDLLQMLHKIQGIQKSNLGLSSEEVNYAGKYSFTLHKEGRFSWEDVLPKIQQTIQQYFTKPVEFLDLGILNKASYFALPAPRTA